jgi:hypothetical protein
MPSSLIVVALVVAWLVVLVPMIVRKRQEIARTADSALAARVVRSGEGEEGVAEPSAEEAVMHDADEIVDLAEDEPVPEAYPAVDQPVDRPVVPAAPVPPAGSQSPRFRPGRGGFDPEAAAVIAKAKYAFRQRVVLAMIVGAIVTAVAAAVVFPALWWPHGVLDLMLVSYLGYLRRQVRIEQEIRERRLARMGTVRRTHAHPHINRPAPTAAHTADPDPEPDHPRREPIAHTPRRYANPTNPPGTVIVDPDDEDPAFEDLDDPANLPYRRAVGE